MKNIELDKPRGTCQCPGPGFCSRYNRTMSPRAHAICSGSSGLSPQKAAEYQKIWSKMDRPPPPVTHIAEPVGDELAKMFSWFGQVKSGSCRCKQLQARMNGWGIKGCRANRHLILDKIEKEALNRGIPVFRTAINLFLEAACWRASFRQRRTETTAKVQ